MKSYTISAEEGMKLLTDCSGWFGKTTNLFLCIRWLAGRCKAPTLSANVKFDATCNFLMKYFDVEQGFRI